MRTSATDLQKIKKVLANETVRFVIQIYGMIAILGIVLGAILKIA
jgi:hypothetical protein